MKSQKSGDVVTSHALVLGAGMVGSVIAEDLLDSGFQVTIADRTEEALARIAERSNGAVHIRQVDCSDVEVLKALSEGVDIVFGALPSWLGFAALETMIQCNTPMCDISFMAEDARALDTLAKEKGTTCIVDIGVAPGMSHILCGYAVHLLDTCQRLDIVVGGLPVQRIWPYEYKAPFSPRDVIEEYIRPARIVEHGSIVTRPALSECVNLNLPKIGTLEAFNSDGLRTLCDTLDVPFMRERTLRYPGHVEQMRALKEVGFFSEEKIDVQGQDVRPLDLTAEILMASWKFEDGEEDLTVMRVEAEGTQGGDHVELRWDLLDYYDTEKQQSSMGRTTGFPAAAMGRMIVDGTIEMPGVHPPETFGQDETIIRRLLCDLESRDVNFHKSKDSIR